MEILKFRAFSSRQREGFVLFKRGPLPDIILEDILFQLFEPLFPEIYCPQIYFFSSTDEILRAEELGRVKDYIYVHFLQRIEKYVRERRVSQKLKLGSIEKMSVGLSFEGTELFIFRERQYLMYGKPIFREAIERKIRELTLKQQRKTIKYNEYIHEMTQLKDNYQMIQLKNQIKTKVEEFKEKVANMETLNARCLKIKATLSGVLKNSGIFIKSLSDL